MSELSRLCDTLKIKCVAEYGGVEVPEGWTPGTHPYKCRMRFQGRAITVPFYCGPAITREPSAADVLYCLCSDTRAGEQDFGEFCSELGYDQDSRKAERIWKACVRTAPKVRRFLGDNFDAVANAEH